MLNSWTLLLAQLVAHAGFASMFFLAKPWQWAIVLVVYFFNGCIGMTATYHRLLSHRSWNPPKWVEYFGVLCATIGMTGSAIAWVAIHRKHHRFADTEKDPHSPSFKGFIYCQWLSMFEPVELRYVMDLSREPFYLFQHKHYFLINGIYALFLYIIGGWQALIYAWLAPACLLWNAGSSIVTLSHMFGGRPNSIKSKAGNNWLLGLLVWGEGWHNNHHFDAKRKAFGQSFWQVDIGYIYIMMMEKICRKPVD